LAVVDASECPPTFGVPHGLVIGIIAGGKEAMFQAVEFAEDDVEQAWKDLSLFNITPKDIVVGVAASGSTPYVVGGLHTCRANNITTGSIACNPASAISKEADFPIEVIVGPEFITGSTRLKSGTAQKLILNMISTAVMIQLGRVEDNKMVNMQLTNEKLLDRGVKMLMQKLNLEDYEVAKSLLIKQGSVKKAIEQYK
jgi:N-acetylmuramic acid 6-phosphate etherase